MIRTRLLTPALRSGWRAAAGLFAAAVLLALRGCAAAPPGGPHLPARYEVKAGDTLEKIAGHFYGDPARGQIILEANRQILNTPAGLTRGQVLAIPVPPEAEDFAPPSKP